LRQVSLTGTKVDIIYVHMQCLRGFSSMRTTLVLDDELLARARELTDIQEKTALVREALKALVERESARRLARLGGSAPDLVAPPRRRLPPK
jgi:Arc/MetJ family transcription regulator